MEAWMDRANINYPITTDNIKTPTKTKSKPVTTVFLFNIYLWGTKSKIWQTGYDVKPFISSFGRARTNKIQQRVSGMWEKSEVPRENLRKPTERMFINTEKLWFKHQTSERWGRHAHHEVMVALSVNSTFEILNSLEEHISVRCILNR